MIKLKDIIKENPDGFSFQQREYAWPDNGIYTYMIYRDLVDQRDYWIAWDYAAKKVLCENVEVTKELYENVEKTEVIIQSREIPDEWCAEDDIDFGLSSLDKKPTHLDLLRVLSILRRADYARNGVYSDGRMYNTNEGIKIMTFWSPESEILRHRKKFDEFLNVVGINTNQLLVEKYNGEFVSYYEYFGTKPPETSEFERKKMQMAKELHMNKAKLDKAIIAALQSKPKNVNDLYVALEKQLNLPIAKIRNMFGSVPLRPLVAKQLRELFGKL